MKYRNTRTGKVIDVPDVINGADWEPLTKEPKAEPKAEPKGEPQGEPKEKGKRK